MPVLRRPFGDFIHSSTQFLNEHDGDEQKESSLRKKKELERERESEKEQYKEMYENLYIFVCSRMTGFQMYTSKKSDCIFDLSSLRTAYSRINTYTMVYYVLGRCVLPSVCVSYVCNCRSIDSRASAGALVCCNGRCAFGGHAVVGIQR